MVNSSIVMLYWGIGERIRREVLLEKRAEYGQEIVPTLSAQLQTEFGQGFAKRSLFRIIRFTELFPEREIVTSLARELSSESPCIWEVRSWTRKPML